MPVVNIKGVGQAQFPDDMPTEAIREAILQKFPSQFTSEHPNLDAYLQKVTSGGFLKENVERFDTALASARGEAFEGKVPTTDENLLDFFAPAAMTAFHGSPHKFSKFSTENIGTGEGAQAFGHGLYFAENKGVAEGYQKTLTKPQALIDGKTVKYTANSNSIDDIAIDAVEFRGVDGALEHSNKMLNEGVDPEFVSNYRTAVESLRGKKVEITGEGSLFEVDIPDEQVKNFLNWDKPLSKQPKAVQSAFNDFAKSDDGIAYAQRFHSYKNGDTLLDIPEFKDRSSVTGETLNNVLGNADNQITLGKHGVKGIKYLDRASRGAGEGSSNLVVFDDSIIKTLKINGEVIK